MLRKIVCLAFFIHIVFAEPPGPSPWSSYAEKSVYQRALGPPKTAGINSIGVPFKPKGSPFFPKFVDPTMFISKKNDMLTNLFGGLGPANYPGAVPSGSFGYFGTNTPVLYAEEPTNEAAELKEILGDDKTPVSDVKRGLSRPVGPKFGPFGPKFGPGSSPIRPFGGTGSKFGSSDALDVSDPSDSLTHRKRSITGFGIDAVSPPPAYPELGPISEETDMSGSPKEFLPGMFGPFGPFGPVRPFAAGPGIDPRMVASKKTSFLDTIFKNLATSTPAPVDTVTDIPVVKSTIVPPDFWVPSSIIPGPMEYTNKVSDFLDKLSDSLKLNKTATATSSSASLSKPTFARSVEVEPEFSKSKVSTSIDYLTTISTAKDAIVDSIVGELGSLKTDMFNTMNDLIAAQSTVAPVSPFAKPVKPGKPVKPVSPFKAAFASMWAPPPPADITLPFKEKMTVLSQVFDMLTSLQKNITLAIQDSIAKSAVPETTSNADTSNDDSMGSSSIPASQNFISGFNTTLFDAIKSKLDNFDTPTPVNPYMSGKYARSIPEDTENDDGNEHHNHNQVQFKRGFKMPMNQGYQNMPSGVDTIPEHQGSGINFIDQQQNSYEDRGNKWAQWAEYMRNQNGGRRNHHHNHH